MNSKEHRGLIGLIGLIGFLSLFGCTESFEERCRREAREYTARQCPRLVDSCIKLDSMVFDEDPIGFSYYYTVMDELDNPDLLTDELMQTFREEMLASLRKDISLRTFKERGFVFSYRYFSASTGEPFAEASFGPEEYQ